MVSLPWRISRQRSSRTELEALIGMLRSWPGRLRDRAWQRLLGLGGRGVATCVLLILAIIELVYSWPRGDHWWDLNTFLASGQAVRAGENPYAVPIDGAFIVSPNYDPPVLLPLFSWLSQMPLPTAFRAVWLGSFALYLGLAIALSRTVARRHRLLCLAWLLAISPLYITLYLGQIYVPLALLSTAAWRALQRADDRRAGILIGIIVAVKPNFGIWPLALLLGGFRASAVAAIATACLLGAVPLVAYGPNVYLEWLDVVARGSVVGDPQSGSFLSIAGILGHRELARAVGYPLAILLLAAVGGWIIRSHPQRLEVSRCVLVTCALVSPVFWAGYLLLLLPLFFWRRWTFWTVLASALALFSVTPLPAYLALGADSLHLVLRGVSTGESSPFRPDSGASIGGPDE